MGLESVNLISDFNVDWPLPTDKRRQGDDHLRNIKRGIKNTFPNIEGVVTASHEEINLIPEILTALQDLIEPVGTIKGWDAVNRPTLPAGWQLCDGTVVSGYGTVPDMRNRFVRGVNVLEDAGSTGGAASATTNEAGAHNHGGATGSHTLTVAQIPPHAHPTSDQVFVDEADVGPGVNYIVAGTGRSTGNTGGGEGHTHTISEAEAHSHTVATVPPYYSFVWIVKVAPTSIS